MNPAVRIRRTCLLGIEAHFPVSAPSVSIPNFEDVLPVGRRRVTTSHRSAPLGFSSRFVLARLGSALLGSDRGSGLGSGLGSGDRGAGRQAASAAAMQRRWAGGLAAALQAFRELLNGGRRNGPSLEGMPSLSD